MNNIIIGTEEHFQEIHDWLKEEYNRKGFFHNIHGIKCRLFDGNFFVYLLGGEIVGFICGNDHTIDVLNVKENYRSSGIGTQLYDTYEEFIIDQTLDEGETREFHVQCYPERSTVFWVKMGFTVKLVDEGKWSKKIVGTKYLRDIKDESNQLKEEFEDLSPPNPSYDKGLNKKDFLSIALLIIIGVLFTSMIVYLKHGTLTPPEPQWKPIIIESKWIDNGDEYIKSTSDKVYRIWTLEMYNEIKVNQTIYLDPNDSTPYFITYYRRQP